MNHKDTLFSGLNVAALVQLELLFLVGLVNHALKNARCVYRVPLTADSASLLAPSNPTTLKPTSPVCTLVLMDSMPTTLTMSAMLAIQSVPSAMRQLIVARCVWVLETSSPSCSLRTLLAWQCALTATTATVLTTLVMPVTRSAHSAQGMPLSALNA